MTSGPTHPDDLAIHGSCEAVYDGETVGPACSPCLDQLGRMDYYGGRR